MKVDAIQFRMYNTGSVGDCLLLLFLKQKTVTFSMLIDCGGWLAKASDITACVADINTTCNGHLNLLVVTHQHMDHISGFNQAREEFDKIRVDEVWMSWIEDNTDDIADILKEKYGKKLKEAKSLAEKAVAKLNLKSKLKTSVRGVNTIANQRINSLNDTLALIRFEMGITGLGPAARPTNDQAMKYIKSKAKKIDYKKPGEVIKNLNGAEGIKFNILGPPRDKDMRFFKIDMKEEEMYHLAIATVEDNEEADDKEYMVKTGIILEDGVSPFSKEFHGTAKITFSDPQEQTDYQWRGIESDWLETAAAIAMRATRLTNNTSLAMALEFENSGKVILLPGDAQSGNWMGWHKPDVKKKLKAAGGKDTEDLLKNTVFYKVGHHGSHNGTASFSGLDLVNTKELVAFMPLVQDKVPEEWGGADNFPAKKLYEVLISKTRGRVVRTDVGLIQDPLAVKSRKKLSPKEKAEFNKNFSADKIYVQYIIMDR